MGRLRRKSLTLVGCALLVLGGCSDRTRVEVRTALPDELRDAVEDIVEAAHADVNLVFSDEPDETTLEQLRAGPVDFVLWWGAPALTLQEAAAEGLVTPIDDRAWEPIATTPLVMAFDRRIVALSDAPLDWLDVFHHAYYDDVRVPNPLTTDAGRSLVGAVLLEAIRRDGDTISGMDWLARLDDQVDVYTEGADEAIRALPSQEALLAVVPRADAERARNDFADWLHYRLPESGTPELVLGMALPAGDAEQPVGDGGGAVGGQGQLPDDRIEAVLATLRSPEVATAIKRWTHWEPVTAPVDRGALPREFELDVRWTGYAHSFDTVAAEIEGWLELWTRDVRGR